ncbi:MAG: ankyrin repeat domain-containing protein [Bryobacter sp.]|nr:ankyrin repeat domain-containing protein [Bryobacter sp.]
MKQRLIGFLVALGPLFGLDSREVIDALRRNDPHYIKKNISNPNDPMLSDGKGNTPLLWASALGSPESVAILLQNGANPNTANAFGVTPLMAGAVEPAKVKLLLAAGADPKAKAKSGQHALAIAAAAPTAHESVKQLLAAGAPVNESSARGSSALLGATFEFCADRNVKLLLAAGAKADAADGAGFRALHAAVDCEEATLAELSRHGAEASVANSFGGKVRHGDIQLVGLTPLHMVAAHGDVAKARRLLSEGADVNAKDVRGMTPLLMALASEDQNAEMVKLLLKSGAERTAKDIYGQDAVAWARKFNSPGVLKVLGAQAEGMNMSTTAKRGPGLGAAASLLEEKTESFFAQSGCIACHASNLSSFALERASHAGLATNKELTEVRRKRLAGMLAMYLPNYLQYQGPPGDTDSVVYALFEAKALGLPATPELEMSAKYLLSRQAEKGYWSMRGIPRAPMEENNLHRTALALYVLPEYLPAGLEAHAKPQLAQAMDWLSRQAAHSTDERAFKLLGLVWGKAPEASIAAAARELAAAQLPDGSWGGNAHLAGDAYSTGLALYALVEAKQGKMAAKSVDAAKRWLLGTQAADGSWHVKSRALKFQPYFESGFPYGHDQWISMAGTAWAVAGLSGAGAIQ